MRQLRVQPRKRAAAVYPVASAAPTSDVTSADARGNVHQRGDTESRADLAGRIDQPTRKSLLKMGDAAAACHRCGEGGAAGPKPDGEENCADEQVVTISDDPREERLQAWWRADRAARCREIGPRRRV